MNTDKVIATMVCAGTMQLCTGDMVDYPPEMDNRPVLQRQPVFDIAGLLLHRAGMDESEIGRLQNDFDIPERDGDLDMSSPEARALNLLLTTYEMTDDELFTLIDVNDSYVTPPEPLTPVQAFEVRAGRYRCVMAFLCQWKGGTLPQDVFGDRLGVEAWIADWRKKNEAPIL